MNAADQRRMTPVLGVLGALAALWLGALAFGLGRQVHWLAAGKAASLPTASAVAHRAPPPLDTFAEVWQHPLFTTDRQPAPEAAGEGGNVTLGDLELTGIVLTPDVSMALLHGRSGNDVRVRVGEGVANSGWTLVALKPQSAVFTRNGQRTVLKLKVASVTGIAEVPDAPPQAAGKVRDIPGRAVHPGRAARLRLNGGRGGAPVNNGKGKPPPGVSPEQQRRTQALKARIESRRRQMQAQQNQEH